MYYRLIAACPVLWLVGTFSFTLSLLAWSLYQHSLPSFDDPLVGFEVRDTNLARRLNTWRLLTEATAWNGVLSLYPTATTTTTTSQHGSSLHSDKQNSISEILPPPQLLSQQPNDNNDAKIVPLSKASSLHLYETTTIANLYTNILETTSVKPKKRNRHRGGGGGNRRRQNNKQRKDGKKRLSTTTTTTTTTTASTSKNFADNNSEVDYSADDDYDKDKDDNDKSSIVSSSSSTNNPFHSKSHAASEHFFCGKLLEDYAQFVVEPVKKKSFLTYTTQKQSLNFTNKGLLELQSIRDLCTLDTVALRLGGLPYTENTTKNQNNSSQNSSFSKKSNSEPFHFELYCENRGGGGGDKGQCCRSWSVANYILLLAGKDDCSLISEDDVTNFVRLLSSCAPFYADNYLSEECYNGGAEGKPSSACPNVPPHCTAHENLVFTVFHYLVDFRFLNIDQLKAQIQGKQILSNQSTSNTEPIHFHLYSTSIFLPMAKSSKLLAYYRAITQFKMTTLSPPQSSVITTLSPSTSSNITTNFSSSTIFPRNSIAISNLGAGSVQVVAADLGCKESLFSEALVSDLALLLLSSAIIFGSVLAYTGSFLLTVTALLTNVASLGTAYFLYSDLFGVTFFPFLNLLSLIILIGIGSDSALIYCKAWACVALMARESGDRTVGCRLSTIENNFINSESTIFSYHQQQLSVALCHVLTSTFCASLTTCVAFFAGYFTSITSLRCFALFAGIAIAVNFFITVITFPAAIIISEQKWCTCGSDQKKRVSSKKTTYFGGSGGNGKFSHQPKSSRFAFSRWSSTFSTFLFQRVILRLVFNYRHLLALVFFLLGIGASSLVFYRPGLRLPTTADFQVFSSEHLFERYDLQYLDRFWFSRNSFETRQTPASLSENSSPQLPSSNNNNNIVLPIRLVFGVLPLDTGDHLDPFKRGQLTFDPAFNLSSPQSQEWLLGLCTDLRSQPFFRPTLGPLLGNCFIETFKTWMEERRCKEEQLGAEVGEKQVEIENRFPCCQASAFPYKPAVFDHCLVEVVERLHKTPSHLFNLNGRSAGPRFEAALVKNSTIFNSISNFSTAATPQVKAIIIEYDSVFDAFTTGRSFEEMATLWSSVDHWLKGQLKTAPEGLRSGWFVTGNSHFFALQSALSSGVYQSLVISVGLAFATLVLTTANLRLSVLSTLSISGAIFSTIGALVWGCEWRLNVIESITISLTIGLAIDATLHYTIVYQMLAKDNNHLLGIQMTVARVGSPVAMGALTTFLAGSVMTLFSSILAYIQIGTFLMVLSVASWLFSTLFHLSLLSIFGVPSSEEKNSIFSKLKNLFSSSKQQQQIRSGEEGNGNSGSCNSMSLPTTFETEFSRAASAQPPTTGTTTTTTAPSTSKPSSSFSLSSLAKDDSFEQQNNTSKNVGQKSGDNIADNVVRTTTSNNNNNSISNDELYIASTKEPTKTSTPNSPYAFMRVTSI